MRILRIEKIIFYSFTLCISSSYLSAQNRNININQDPRFEQLLNEKRKINTSITVNERYKIQIFSGDSENARKSLSDCKQEFRDLEGTIIFNTPNYKVWVGNFRTRMEAEHYLVDLKKKYANAFLIKPQK